MESSPESEGRIALFLNVIQGQALFIIFGVGLAWFWAAWRRSVARRSVERDGAASVFCAAEGPRPGGSRSTKTTTTPTSSAGAPGDSDECVDESDDAGVGGAGASCASGLKPPKVRRCRLNNASAKQRALKALVISTP